MSAPRCGLAGEVAGAVSAGGRIVRFTLC
jgi:hypothetical protein